MDDLPELTWSDVVEMFESGNYAEEERRAKEAEAIMKRWTPITDDE